MAMSVARGVIVERVGDDLMVIVPGASEVLSLSGRSAEMLLDVKAGRTVDSADPALRDLVDLGVVSAPGLSRRGLIKASAIGAGAGIAVLAMPGVAAASSSPIFLEEGISTWYSYGGNPLIVDFLTSPGFLGFDVTGITDLVITSDVLPTPDGGVFPRTIPVGSFEDPDAYWSVSIPGASSLTPSSGFGPLTGTFSSISGNYIIVFRDDN